MTELGTAERNCKKSQLNTGLASYHALLPVYYRLKLEILHKTLTSSTSNMVLDQPDYHQTIYSSTFQQRLTQLTTNLSCPPSCPQYANGFLAGRLVLSDVDEDEVIISYRFSSQSYADAT